MSCYNGVLMIYLSINTPMHTLYYTEITIKISQNPLFTQKYRRIIIMFLHKKKTPSSNDVSYILLSCCLVVL